MEAVAVRNVAAADGNLALISTPGTYAAAEALKALRTGKNVFLFSDNVPIEQELMLKKEAHEKGLIVMRPDCGTGMVAGVPLGFANLVREDDAGLIGASGTGLQQVMGLVHNSGGGVSHAIGVGRRDLSADIGAISMHDAIDALAADPNTKVIGLVSKPSDTEVAEAVLAHAASTGKPVVAAFLGSDARSDEEGVVIVPTLEGAARALIEASTGKPTPEAVEIEP